MTPSDNEWDASAAAQAATETAGQAVGAAGDAARQVGETVRAAGAQVRDNLAAVSSLGADHGQFVLNSFRAGADAFTASVEASFGKASAGLTDLNIKAVDILRENVNSSFELWEQMIGARTLNQVVDLQADHARKRVELLGEQGRALSSLAQKIAYDSFEPLRSGFTAAA